MHPRVVLFGTGAVLALIAATGGTPTVAAQTPAARVAPPRVAAPLGAQDASRVAAYVTSRDRRLPVALTSRLRASRLDTVPMYTEEQLTTGTETYKKVCMGCHEDTDYTNDKFKAAWNGKTLHDLYTYVHDKMPDDNPGSLTPEEYAGSIAYVLKLNGVPAGPAKVMPDSAAMMAIKLNFAAAGSK